MGFVSHLVSPSAHNSMLQLDEENKKEDMFIIHETSSGFLYIFVLFVLIL